MSTPFENSFAACVPYLKLNDKTCGSITVCDAKPVEADQLEDTFMASGDFKILEALLRHDVEAKMCRVVQNSMYDFFAANRVAVPGRKLQIDGTQTGLTKIRPFYLQRRLTPINNEWFKAFAGKVPTDFGSDNANGDWQVNVDGMYDVPIDERWFPVKLRVFIDGVGDGGQKTSTAWRIYAVQLINGGTTAQLLLVSENDASFLDPDKVEFPTAGLLTRGTPNVNPHESWCVQAPGVLNWKDEPIWFEDIRDARCTSQAYEEWRKLVVENNPLYRERYDLPQVQLNAQLAADWQKRLVHQIFWGKALNTNQTVNAFNSLPEIAEYSVDGLDTGSSDCVGRRANLIGIYEQIAQCGGVFDLGGAALNLPALFDSAYELARIRNSAQTADDTLKIDLFMDTVTAEKFHLGMMKAYKQRATDAGIGDNWRLNTSFDGPQGIVGQMEYKIAPFGFRYRTYSVPNKPGLYLNVVVHWWFDDQLRAASASATPGLEDAMRMIWILDIMNIEHSIIESVEAEHDTGNLNVLANVDPGFACVIKKNTRRFKLFGMKHAVNVKCPAGNVILENIADTVPSVTPGQVVYPPVQTTTTTTGA